MAADLLIIDVVSPEGPIWEGKARAISLPGLEGEFGILPGRQPILAILRAGKLRITTEKGKEVTLAIPDGFVVADDDRVTACVSKADADVIVTAVAAD